MASPPGAETTAPSECLDVPYLLVTFLPCYEDPAGQLWLDPLWRRDLQEQLQRTVDLTLAAPRCAAPDPRTVETLRIPAGVKLRFVPLPEQSSRSRALATLPLTGWRLWRAIGAARIVHSSVVGWPYPLGWLANAIALLRRRLLVLVIESAPWRSSVGGAWRRRIRAHAMEGAARWFVRKADVVFFTHGGYRDSLGATTHPGAHVVAATWVDAVDVREEDAARRDWDAREQEPPRLLMAGRLVPEKGVAVLLEALRRLDGGASLEVDIVGEGTLRPACLAAAGTFRSIVLRVLDPVPYGASFFALLRRYHALVLPSLGDEQPRVLFDAAAQALPVIASETPGIAAYVEHGRSGWLTPPGDPDALAAAIRVAVAEPGRLRALGLEALARARGSTHQAMHATRTGILLGALARQVSSRVAPLETPAVPRS